LPRLASTSTFSSSLAFSVSDSGLLVDVGSLDVEVDDVLVSFVVIAIEDVVAVVAGALDALVVLVGVVNVDFASTIGVRILFAFLATVITVLLLTSLFPSKVEESACDANSEGVFDFLV
jgi:hypothetical protein